jgi:hypothetical protein
MIPWINTMLYQLSVYGPSQANSQAATYSTTAFSGWERGLMPYFELAPFDPDARDSIDDAKLSESSTRVSSLLLDRHVVARLKRLIVEVLFTLFVMMKKIK